MPPFRRVGTVLKERFDGATEVGLLHQPMEPFQVPYHTKCHYPVKELLRDEKIGNENSPSFTSFA